MSGERRLDGDLRGLEIADLADHDDVGILPHDRAKQGGEVEPDLGLDLDLVDPRSWYSIGSSTVTILRDTVLSCKQAGIKGGGLAAAGWTGHQHDAIRQLAATARPRPAISGAKPSLA